MPSGYTAPVQSGEITNVVDYAMECARAFGACIMLRDDPDQPIPEAFEPSDYHLKAVESARAELSRIEAMSTKECMIAAAEEYEAESARIAERLAEVRLSRGRYESMLAEVNALSFPETHAKYHDFLRSQLTESIERDCDSTERYYTQTAPAVRMSGSAWREKKLESLLWDIEYHEKNYAEEVERVRGRNEWIATLRSVLSNAKAEALP